MPDLTPNTATVEPTEAGLLAWYTCRRKVRHPDGRAARAAISILGESIEAVAAYKCDRCDGWHIGNRTKRVSPNARRRRKELVRTARAAWRNAGRPSWSS